MKYRITPAGFEQQLVEVQTSFFGTNKLLLNGAIAPKGPKRGEFSLTSDSGEQVVASWKPDWLSPDVPVVVMRGEELRAAPQLTTTQAALVILPLPLCMLMGGWLTGAIFGALAGQINVFMFRQEWPSHLSILASLVVSGIAVFFVFMIAVIVTLLIS